MEKDAYFRNCLCLNKRPNKQFLAVEITKCHVHWRRSSLQQLETQLQSWCRVMLTQPEMSHANCKGNQSIDVRVRFCSCPWRREEKKNLVLFFQKMTARRSYLARSKSKASLPCIRRFRFEHVNRGFSSRGSWRRRLSSCGRICCIALLSSVTALRHAFITCTVDKEQRTP